MIFIKHIAEDVETRFDNSNYELPKVKTKKKIRLMKDEKCGKTIPKFFRKRAKSYSYLTDDVKRKLKFENYKNWLEPTQLDNKIKYLDSLNYLKLS